MENIPKFQAYEEAVSLSICKCSNRFEVFLLEGIRTCQNGNSSIAVASCFPAFFTTDLLALQEYVESAMTKWLVVNSGGPFHFQGKKGNMKTVFPTHATVAIPNASEALDAGESTWADFLAISQATWTIALRKSDFSELPGYMVAVITGVCSSTS